MGARAIPEHLGQTREWMLVAGYFHAVDAAVQLRMAPLFMITGALLF